MADYSISLIKTLACIPLIYYFGLLNCLIFFLITRTIIVWTLWLGFQIEPLWAIDEAFKQDDPKNR